MPFDATEQPAGTKTPSEQEIDAQLDILSAQDSIKGDKRVDLLRFLIDQKRRERFIGPFRRSRKSRPANKSSTSFITIGADGLGVSRRCMKTIQRSRARS